MQAANYRNCAKKLKMTVYIVTDKLFYDKIMNSETHITGPHKLIIYLVSILKS